MRHGQAPVSRRPVPKGGQSATMSHREFPTQLAARGRYHFTTEQAASELGVSLTAARAALRRLRDRGAIATPLRGFHVVVPPEYRTLSCLPPEQFVPQLMELLGVVYYAGLVSAAGYHGASHQQLSRTEPLNSCLRRNGPGAGLPCSSGLLFPPVRPRPR